MSSICIEVDGDAPADSTHSRALRYFAEHLYGSPGVCANPTRLVALPDEIEVAVRQWVDEAVATSAALPPTLKSNNIVAPMLFLASDEAGFITGQTVTVNEGRWMA